MCRSKKCVKILLLNVFETKLSGKYVDVLTGDEVSTEFGLLNNFVVCTRSPVVVVVK